MVTVRSILAYGLSTMSVVSGWNMDQCTKHGLKTAYERGTGKIGGGEFCASQIKDGVLINGLECWADGNSLRALKFYYTDGSEMMVGSKANMNSRTINQRVNWNPIKDRIEWLRLWDNGWNNIIGRIDMKVAGGGQINCGRYANWGEPSVDADRGAGGMMIGAAGGAGDGIDYIKFSFTASSPSRVTLKNLEIPDLKTNNGLQEVKAQTLRIINRTNETITTGPFHRSWETEKSRSLDTSETKTFGFEQSFGISATLPNGPTIGSDSKFTWGTENVQKEAKFDSDKDTFDYSIEGGTTIKPGKAKKITLLGMKGEMVNAPYSATMEVTFKDSSTFTYTTKALFGIVRSHDITDLWEDQDAEEAIKEVRGNKATELDKDGKEVSKPKIKREFRA